VSRERRRTFFDMVDAYFKRAEHIAERILVSGWNEISSCIEPLSSVFVGTNDVIVTVDLPYADSKSVRVKVIGEGAIEVKAQTTRMINLYDLGLKHRSGIFSSYHGIIHIPVPVEERGVTRSFKRGILEIRLPRTV